MILNKDTQGEGEGLPQIVEEDFREIVLEQIENIITKEGGAVEGERPTVNYGKLYSLASPSEKALMITGWLFAVISGLGMPSWVYLTGDVVDGFDPSKDTDFMEEQVYRVCRIQTFVGVVLMFTNYAYYACLSTFSERVANKTRIRYLEAILSQDCAWYDLSHPHELSANLRKEVKSISNALGEKMGTVIVAFSMSFAGIGIALARGWSFSLVCLATFPLIIIPTQCLTSIQQKDSAIGMKSYGQSAGYAEQALNGIRAVAAFGQEQTEFRNYTQFLDNARLTGIRLARKKSMVLAVFMFASLFCYAYSFFLGTFWMYYEIYNDTYGRNYSAGDIIACFFGVNFGLYSISMVGPNIKAVSQGKIAGKTVFDIIDRVPVIQLNDKRTLRKKIQGKIEFRNITFVYPARPFQKVFEDLNVQFQAGKTTALVGPSGSGKTTIVQLLERFYDPRLGEVLIDGTPLKTINLKNYRSQIGYVGQEPILFNTTIRDNVRYGRPEATDKDIIEALKVANAHDFVMCHPNGINLDIGQHGGHLSGSQKQKIALARAFLKKPKILILDEATSSLDAKSEKEVQSAIESVKAELGEITTIVISQRLAAIKDADNILVLKKGKIVERGTHQALLQVYPEGVYAKFVALQWTAEEEEQSAMKETSIINTHQVEFQTIREENEEDEDGDVKLRDDFGFTDFAFCPKADTEQNLQNLYGPEDNGALLKNTMTPRAQALRRQSSMDEEKRITITVDQKDDEEEDREIDEILLLEQANFRQRLRPYSLPHASVVISVILSCFNGCIWPAFGALMNKCLFTLMNDDLDEMKKDAWMWSLYMFICSILSLVTIFVVRFLFAIVSENITDSIRRTAFFSLLKKSPSFFDEKENSTTTLATALASDVCFLHGASTEGLAITLESLMGFLCGSIIAFLFSWQLTLLTIATFPLVTFGGWGQAFFTGGLSEDEEAYKDADMLAGDTILNQRTVASFGSTELLISQFERFLEQPHRRAKKNAQLVGAIFGFSQFLLYAVHGLLFWAGVQFILRKPEKYDGEDVMMATFVMMFGAFAAGQANQYGPDVGKAKKAALRIFGYIEGEPRINAVDEREGATPLPEKIQGEIEFRNVWFRYPTKKEEWVFKGLNLKINPNESVALLGVSGCGKSTLVNLIMRFYDPCEGEILVDRVNIKQYNLREYRQRIGLVMQDPSLFNYTIKENILYGKEQAKDSEIREAAEIANAMEFIESKQLLSMVKDTAQALKEVFTLKKYEFLDLIEEEEYKEKLEQLKRIERKQTREGNFDAVKGITDRRESKLKDIQLPEGFEVDCGWRGGKLSEGQKQRIAIARAVIRKPQILLLDEATKALDEDSQKKVNKALENIMEGRTFIVIAHRLTTVEKCKRIVVLENGKVAEDGTAEELKTKNGWFARIQRKMEKRQKKETRKLIGTNLKDIRKASFQLKRDSKMESLYEERKAAIVQAQATMAQARKTSQQFGRRRSSVMQPKRSGIFQERKASIFGTGRMLF